MLQQKENEMTRSGLTARERRHELESEQILDWVEALNDKDMRVRKEARKAIVASGGDGLMVIIDELQEGPFLVRWELAQILGELRLPAGIPVLIRALEDEEQDVRWVAAEALADMGRPALPALLEALRDRADSGYLRNGVHHVLTLMPDTRQMVELGAVLDALDPLANAVDVIPAAARALAALRR